MTEAPYCCRWRDSRQSCQSAMCRSCQNTQDRSSACSLFFRATTDRSSDHRWSSPLRRSAPPVERSPISCSSRWQRPHPPLKFATRRTEQRRPSASTLYTGPFRVSQSSTVKARGFAADMLFSVDASASFTIILPQVSTPAISPAGGNFGGPVTVTLALPTPAASQEQRVRSFPLNGYKRVLDGQWQGIRYASDGNVYFGSSTQSGHHGAAFFKYDPRTDQITLLAEDITTIMGEDPHTNPQGSLHSDIVEANGWLYMSAYYASELDGAVSTLYRRTCHRLRTGDRRVPRLRRRASELHFLLCGRRGSGKKLCVCVRDRQECSSRFVPVSHRYREWRKNQSRPGRDQLGCVVLDVRRSAGRCLVLRSEPGWRVVPGAW